jgi:hypothetical protein
MVSMPAWAIVPSDLGVIALVILIVRSTGGRLCRATGLHGFLRAADEEYPPLMIPVFLIGLWTMDLCSYA